MPRLAHAIAVGEARGPAAGLAAVEAVLPLLPRERYPFGEAARAEFLQRLGRDAEALEAWRAARAQARSDAERALVDARIATLAPPL